MKKLLMMLCCSAITLGAAAQSFVTYTSSEGDYCRKGTAKAVGKSSGDVVLKADAGSPRQEFKSWGTCMNELDWDALNILSESDRNEILDIVFGQQDALSLGYTMGRITMNANDYSRSWYSCDEVDGDFQLRYFNIDRDRETTIPFIKETQKRCKDMVFWMSPWSPPSWMKINHHYAVQSSKYNDLDPKKDYLLYGDDDRSENEQVKPDPNKFPRRLATQDFFIQEPRYLQTYADCFCRFIDEYAKEGIPISMIMYQNEAYSYTAYPGCAWTSDGILRFNMEYLAPTLKRKHPEVALYLGTFNTNRLDHVDGLLSDSRMKDNIKGVGLQWEGRQILPQLHQKYPDYEYISSESECGWGAFGWGEAERTFFLMTDFIGNGCSRYTFWNCILTGGGVSPWGWRQSALVKVDSDNHTYTLCPEFYSVWHFAHFVRPGSRLLGFSSSEGKGVNAIAFLSPARKYVVIANNSSDEKKDISIAIGKKFLNISLDPHSMRTLVQK